MAETEESQQNNQPANFGKIPPEKVPAADQTAPELSDSSSPSSAPTDATPTEELTLEPNEIDPETDGAVDDIMKKDGDDVLQAQDEAADSVVMKSGRWERFKNFSAEWWANPKKRYGTLGGVLVIIALLGIVPVTRYTIAGLILKSQVTVQVLDSKSHTPVSGATVRLAGQTAQTEANGKAIMHVHAGSKTMQVSKKYYRAYEHGELVTLSKSKNTFSVPLDALGHQVKLTVVNKVTGKPVAGAVVGAQGATAKTDSKGMANLVLPSSAESQPATITLSGYNTAKVTIDASSATAKNSFSLTPAGKLYFLSNLSGTLDVVKTNLDGTDRQTVLAGTGNEDHNATSLLASRDWKYLALLSKRSGDKASVYLIDTTNGDKLTTVDQGDAEFTFVGWSGDRFIYEVLRNTVQDSQPNKQAIKSLDASSGQTLLLDQTQGSAADGGGYAKQLFGQIYGIGDQVVYTKGWQGYSTNAGVLNGKQSELDSINADGSGHRTIKQFIPGQYASYTGYDDIGLNSRLYEPDGLYLWFSYHGQDNFYEYENGKVTDDSTMTSDKFYQGSYPTYLLSPSGNQTFWADQRDGKNALFVGDQNAKSPKQIASLSDYTSYGWYTDNYLLVSKNSSELYILSPAGGTPLKITDYYKPAVTAVSSHPLV